ncbi:MAG: ABC transporter permease [Luteimonas sp.]
MTDRAAPRLSNGPLSDLVKHRQLLGKLILRDVEARYQGSAFGLLWSIGTPILMLGVYWFFLGVVLQARWGTAPVAHFPVILFSGLIVHQFFAEVLARASGLIIVHSTYVHKVVFPIEVLPWMTVATAAFHLLINCVILFVGQIVIAHYVPATWIFLPIVLLPILPLVVGLSWIISSLGVYLRDIAQVVPLVIMMMMFMSPIFYSIDMVPAKYRVFIWLNPLTAVIEQVRRVTIEGRAPDAMVMLVYAFAGLFVMAVGYWWFARTKKGFADVL